MGLKVNISGLRFRKSDGILKEVDQLRFLEKRLQNLGVLKVRAGDDPNKLAEYLAKRQLADLRITEIPDVPTVSKIESPAVSVEATLDVPEVIEVPGQSFNVMRAEAMVAQFRQFVREAGYEITGHNADRLRDLLADTTQDKNFLVYASDKEYEEYAKWLNDEFNRKFRTPTEEEWLAVEAAVGGKLEGQNWEWTTTGETNYKVLRSLQYKIRDERPSGYRNESMAIRLIEDKE